MMDQRRTIAEKPPAAPASASPALHRASLALVTSRFQLARPAEAAPEAWSSGLGQLLEWLAVETEFVATSRTGGRLSRMADWAATGGHSARCAPVFAPWSGWSPAAFQHGGIGGLPQARYVASYLIDHSRGSDTGGVDIVLMSPHPAVCVAESAGEIPGPRSGLLRAMIGAARDEGRERLAIIVHARQRNGVARQLLAAGKGLTRGEPTIDILTIEDALVPLMSGAGPWDAIIAMPDLRSTVFVLLAETSGVRGAWPMLWFGRGLELVTSEAPGEGASRLLLDAPALIHALALMLREAGMGGAASRLHDGWARLRDSGVTTAGHGADAPYVTVADDAGFLSMLCRDAAVSKRPQAPWRALQNSGIATGGSHLPTLRVVASNVAVPSHSKGR